MAGFPVANTVLNGGGFPVSTSAPPVLQQTNTAEIQPGGSNPFTVTLPGSYATKLNDCIVIAMVISGTAGTLTVSGCGATWVVTQIAATNIAMAVGYGCTAGGTSVSIGGAAGASGDIVVSIWSGILATSSPVVASQTANNASATTITTPSVSYTANQLVIGMGVYTGGGAAGQWGAGTPATWSSGATNTLIFISQNATATSRPCRSDYFIATGSGSTTLTETLASGSANGMFAIVQVLNHS